MRLNPTNHVIGRVLSVDKEEQEAICLLQNGKKAVLDESGYRAIFASRKGGVCFAGQDTGKDVPEPRKGEELILVLDYHAPTNGEPHRVHFWGYKSDFDRAACARRPRRRSPFAALRFDRNLQQASA